MTDFIGDDITELTNRVTQLETDFIDVLEINKGDQGEPGPSDEVIAALAAQNIYYASTLAAAKVLGLASPATHFWATGADVDYIGLYEEVLNAAVERVQVPKRSVLQDQLDQVDAIIAGLDDSVAAINAAGATQLAAVEAEGAEQVAAVEAVTDDVEAAASAVREVTTLLFTAADLAEGEGLRELIPVSSYDANIVRIMAQVKVGTGDFYATLMVNGFPLYGPIHVTSVLTNLNPGVSNIALDSLEVLVEDINGDITSAFFTIERMGSALNSAYLAGRLKDSNYTMASGKMLARQAAGVGAPEEIVFDRAWMRQNTPRLLSNVGTSQKIFSETAFPNGALTLQEGFYKFSAVYSISAMSATSGNMAIDINGAGTAALASQVIYNMGLDSSTPTAAVGSASVSIVLNANASLAAVVAAATGTGLFLRQEGFFRVTGAGTIIPSCKLANAVATASVDLAVFMVEKLGETGIHSSAHAS